VNGGEKLAMAALAASCIIALAVGLWILEAPRKVREWLEKHSR
jgi:hypothetical protein